MELTLQQAIDNAAGYERQLEDARKNLESLERNSRQWRLEMKRMSEAKMMLKWYQGETDRDANGNITYEDKGLIKKLAGEAQRLKESSNLGARFLNRTFGNFEVKRDPNAYQQCRAYSEREMLFSDKRNGLLILGGVGSGKTHLAAAVSNTFTDRGIPVLFGTFSDHLEHIREEFDVGGQRQYLSMMKNTPVLVLDDVGKEKKTDWSKQILFDVINYRYEHLLPVIITTNFDADGLATHVGNAVWSRLYEMCGGVETKGKDYRIA